MKCLPKTNFTPPKPPRSETNKTKKNDSNQSSRSFCMKSTWRLNLV